jgi:hypothetical protein
VIGKNIPFIELDIGRMSRFQKSRVWSLVISLIANTGLIVAPWIRTADNPNVGMSHTASAASAATSALEHLHGAFYALHFTVRLFDITSGVVVDPS